MTHAASLRSPRLRRVLAVLADGRPHSSLEVVTKGRTMAPSACVSELRIRGARISCEQRREDGRPVWYYTMTEAPPEVVGETAP